MPENNERHKKNFFFESAFSLRMAGLPGTKNIPYTVKSCIKVALE